jgi:hypothetical protein
MKRLLGVHTLTIKGITTHKMVSMIFGELGGVSHEIW